MKTDKINNSEWEDELKDFPHLSNRSKGQPFSAPEGYFDGLSANIMDSIAANDQQEVKEAKIRPFITLKKLVFSSLAIAAVLLAIFLFGRQQQENKMVAMNYDDIYNTGLVSDLDESLLIETLTVESQSPLNNGSLEIENYLIDSSTEDALINSL